MNKLTVRGAPSPIPILSANLDDLLSLSDPEAAESLNTWMAALKRVEEVYEVSYGQRLVIIRHFETRSLWRYLVDYDTNLPFPNLTAWLSSGFIGCRRVNMDAHKDGQKLEDIPADKLIDMPKSSIKVLRKVSTQVRNLPDVLTAARNGEDALLKKLDTEHPTQHLEMRRVLRFFPGRSQLKVIEEWIAYALNHDVAGSRDEAIVRACEMALYDAQLDVELKSMPKGEVQA